MNTQNNQSNSLSLYHLGLEHQKLFANLYDRETGEVDEEVEKALNAISKTTEQKCIGIASFIKTLEAGKQEIAYYKNEILEREKAYNNKISQLESYLLTNMEKQNISDIKCPLFSLKIQINPYSTDIVDESKIPKEFIKTQQVVKTVVSADKNKIKESVLKTGVQVPGTHVYRKKVLKIVTDKI
jgi:hypothetical protein